MTANEPVKLILSETPLKRFQIKPPTPARAGVRIVVQTTKGETKTVPGQRTWGEGMFASDAMEYEIDVAQHDSAIDLAVKTKDEAYSFQIGLRLRWHVERADVVARRRLNDGVEAISAELHDRLTELGRQFSVEQTVEFERQIRTELTRAGLLIEGCLRIDRVTPQVALDEPGKVHLAKLRDLHSETTVMQTAHLKNVLEQEQAGEIARLQQDHELERKAQQHEHEMSVRRAEADFEEAMERRRKERQAAFEQDDQLFQRQMEERSKSFAAQLRALEEERQLEIEKKRALWQSDLKELGQSREFERAKERSRLFVQAWESGSAAVLATHLGNNPEDAKEFIKMIVDQQAAGEERKAEILKEMIEKNLIIEADLEGVSQDLIRAVAGMMSRPDDGLFSLRKPPTVTVEDLTDKEDAAIDDKAAPATQEDADV